MYIIDLFVKNKVVVWAYMWGFDAILLTNESVFVLIPFYYYTSIVQLEIGNSANLSIFLFKIVFSYSGYFAFP